MNVGVLGGGQLGRMLALAGLPLGLRFRFLDDNPDACAARAGELFVSTFEDEQRLDLFEAGLDVVTYEFENVPVVAARRLARRLPVYPPVEALRIGQDRLEEKALFQRLGVPTPRFAPVASRAEFDAALRFVGLPAVLKTRRGGYDGKGQAVLRTQADAEAAWSHMGSVPLILEQFVPFERELSIISVRGRDGLMAFYPLTHNQHRAGILRVSRAPAPGDDPALTARAHEIAGKVLAELQYVGVLAIELFQVGRELMVNELAPRVHNSGHWTQDGAATCQFENHLRAVLGWPLGPTTPRGSAGMINLIGDHPPVDRLLALPGARLHLYGKSPRAGRKLGHINFCAPSHTVLEDQLAAGIELIEPFAC